MNRQFPLVSFLIIVETPWLQVRMSRIVDFSLGRKDVIFGKEYCRNLDNS